MAGCNSKFEDQRFQNWVKASYAGNIAKEGLEDIVLIVISKFHRDILKKISNERNDESGTVCFECSTENLLPCPTRDLCSIKSGNCSFHTCDRKKYRGCRKRICDKLREEIKKSHRFGNPSWKNTHAEEWCTNPLEIAKCYLPREGYLGVKKVSEMDFNGLLNVMINHQAFENIVDQNLCIIVKELGNQLRHSSDLFVDRKNLTGYLNALKTLLTSSAEIKRDKKASEAVDKIQKLETEHLSISTQDMEEVLQKLMEEKARCSQKLIEEKTRCSLRDMEETSKKCLDNLERAVREIKAWLSVQKTVGGSRKRISRSSYCTTLNKKAVMFSSCPHHNSLSGFQLLTEEQYDAIKEKFKEDLMQFNNERNGTIPISPLLDKFDANILDIYVQPEMFSVEVEKSRLGGLEIKYPVESLEDVFRNKNSNCREIYLTADAGLGKTAFCKYLAKLWCHTHKANEDYARNLSDNEIHFLKNFDFLFLIFLRESRDCCDIDNMISKLIIPRLSHSSLYSIQFLQEILHREKCLVILDGLDEWSHPENKDCQTNPKCVPHRKARKRCTILTTSRSWKLCAIDINKSEAHQIEMVGLNKVGKDTLKKRAAERVNSGGKEYHVGDLACLNAGKSSVEINDLEKIPMILMYLVCLQGEGKPLPRSKCELFSNIIDLNLQRNKLRLEHLHLSERLRKDNTSIVNIPECFRSLSSCKQYIGALASLGKLAFYTLFNERRERAIMFESSDIEDVLCTESFEFGLFAGLLTQTEITGYLLSQKSSVSFTHKMFQEFLAAFYIATVPQKSEVVAQLLSVCISIHRILEMSNVLVFLSGMNRHVSEQIAQNLVKVVADDDITHKYRRTESFWDYSTVEEPLKRFQDMQIDCMKEHVQNIDNKLNLSMQDFIIDSKCQQEEYLSALRSLAVFSKNEIKSLSFDLVGIPSLHEIMASFELNDVCGLEHVYIRGECTENDVCHLLSGSENTLKSLAILSRKWQVNHFKGKYSVWSPKVYNIVYRMEKLEAIHLNCLMVGHEHMETLLDFLTRSSKIKEVILGNVSCADHLDMCSGFELDLSKHSDLRTLRLHNLPISSLGINVSSLEQVSIGRLPCRQSSVLSSYLSFLPGATKLERFRCSFLESSRDIDEILRVTAQLNHLKDLRLHCIDLGEKSVALSEELTGIQCVHLTEVKMSSTGFHTFVKTLMGYNQSVLCVLVNCVIGSDYDYAIIKKSIGSNEKLMVVFDGRNHLENDEFSFRTLGLSNE